MAVLPTAIQPKFEELTDDDKKQARINALKDLIKEKEDDENWSV